MNDFETVIGLEVHAELNTRTKIYCSCKNEFGARPNTNICPVCIGAPGALPVLNKSVAEYAVKMGHALNCRINPVSQAARKNYFYPDLPKSYQISQGDLPICGNGFLDIMVDGNVRRIGITRIHIEEDAGKLIHDINDTRTLIDYNRCGVPLIEIVTEPDIRSSREASVFLSTIRNILKYLDISDCKMQEGSIRCDVNVSVRRKGEPLGIRCEMKNINSFSAAVRAIEYESERQISMLENGTPITQETRRWDDHAGISTVMRTKENAQDYRYFPEPDLGYIRISEERIRELKAEIPELPNEKQIRYMNDHGLSEQDSFIIVSDTDKAMFFDKCCETGKCSPYEAAKFMVGEITKYMNDTGTSIFEALLTPELLAELVSVTEEKIISSSGAKTLLNLLIENGGNISQLIKENGLAQNSDSDFIEKTAHEVIDNNIKSVSDYKNGKTNALGYLVGQGMKLSKGSASPQMLRDALIKILTEE